MLPERKEDNTHENGGVESEENLARQLNFEESGY